MSFWLIFFKSELLKIEATYFYLFRGLRIYKFILKTYLIYIPVYFFHPNMFLFLFFYFEK